MHLYDTALFQALDLSVDNVDLLKYDLKYAEHLATYINSTKAAGIKVLPVGGYLERRAIYQRSGHFASGASDRDIHLGIDIWAPAGTAVPAIAHGSIHSYADNRGLGNYGPTIIVHHPELGIYSLYGHLSRESLGGLSVGQHIDRGQIIAQLGTAAVNGDYPPHLHLQIIKDVGKWHGDYPGVSSAADLAYYKDNCPDPLSYIMLYNSQLGDDYET